MIWREWLTGLEKKTGKKTRTVNFRAKEKTGWHHSSVLITGENGEILECSTHSENAFSRMYFRHLIVRPACHACRYAGFQRPGDLTLGDYWGVEKQLPDFNDDKGVSLVLCCSEKGVAAWNAICNRVESVSVEKHQCEQPSLLQRTEEAKGRSLFWTLYRRYGLSVAMKVFKIVPASPCEAVLIKGFRACLRAIGKL